MHVLLLIFVTCFIREHSAKNRTLPDDLILGCATSAYQIEGAWNEDGKGESSCDRFIHTHPELIEDGTNGDIACDSYHKIDEDVALIKDVGFSRYRFSISWTRILPYGFVNVINKEGIKYYNNLIDKLISNGIIPQATLFHFDLPQVLQDLGGWTNSLISKWFEDYARVVFDSFGDRVKEWITVNEPKELCNLGYGNGVEAPGIQSSGVGEYLCTRNVLLTHARAYHLYKNEFEISQKGRISIVNACPWLEPGSNSTADVEATYRDQQFSFGMYTHPIYSSEGDFPEIVKKIVASRSFAEGFTESRLPSFTPEEVSYIRGTYDFFGLNYYSTTYVVNALPIAIGLPSSDKDDGVTRYADPRWYSTNKNLMDDVPWGFRKMLKYIKDHYGDPEVLVTEIGIPDSEEFDNYNATKFHNGHLNALLDAVEIDKVKVKGYTVWSLMDNFAWNKGYTLKYGVYHVDFKDPNRKRTPKLSYEYFKELTKTRILKDKLDERYVKH